MLGRLLGRLVEVPPLPRRITVQIVERVWFDGIFRGATMASIGWVIVLMVVLAITLSRRSRS